MSCLLFRPGECESPFQLQDTLKQCLGEYTNNIKTKYDLMNTAKTRSCNQMKGWHTKVLDIFTHNEYFINFYYKNMTINIIFYFKTHILLTLQFLSLRM